MLELGSSISYPDPGMSYAHARRNQLDSVVHARKQTFQGSGCEIYFWRMFGQETSIVSVRVLVDVDQHLTDFAHRRLSRMVRDDTSCLNESCGEKPPKRPFGRLLLFLSLAVAGPHGKPSSAGHWDTQKFISLAFAILNRVSYGKSFLSARYPVCWSNIW